MAEGRKHAISLRLGSGDIRRINRLAERLGVRNSDVVRFAIKMMLNRLLPLCDPAVRGKQLVPVLAEWGPEAMRHFELDATSLDEVVNTGCDPDDRIALEDLNLLLMVSNQESYAKLSLRALTPPSRPPAGERRDESPGGAFKRHLYRKYGIAADGEEPRKPPSASLVKQVGR